MTIVEGIELDLELSSNDSYDWSLVFSPGSFVFNNTSRQTGRVIFNLNKNDYQCEGFMPCLYSIYYNPKNDKYQIIPTGSEDSCNNLGILIGGFQIRDCSMYFVAPRTCDEVSYVRNFTPEFNNAYVLTEFECLEDAECVADFNDDQFNEAFDTSCVIGECTGGSFGRYGFDQSFDNKLSTCPPADLTPSPLPPKPPTFPVTKLYALADGGAGMVYASFGGDKAISD